MDSARKPARCTFQTASKGGATILLNAVQITDAAKHLTDCHLCPHHCGTARQNASGVCRVGQTTYIASEMLHMGEEECLRPAHAIFFSGCTATCVFCTAAKFAFRPTYGVAVSPRQLATRILQRQQEGARSLCFIGGDPTPHIPFILATLSQLGDQLHIPTVFNSNFYLSNEALALLEGAIDIYLPDLKFGPPVADGDCGQKLGDMPNYWEVVTRCINQLYQEGKSIIVRHLLMPGHLACCTLPVLAWLAARPGIEVSLLTQYLAPAQAKNELAAQLTPAEIGQAQAAACELGLKLIK